MPGRHVGRWRETGRGVGWGMGDGGWQKLLIATTFIYTLLRCTHRVCYEPKNGDWVWFVLTT